MSSEEEQWRARHTGETSLSSVTERLLERIRDGDASGVEDLVRILDPGIIVLMTHHLGRPGTEAQARDTIAVVVQAIQHREICEPQALAAFVREAVLRQIEALPRGGHGDVKHRAGQEREVLTADRNTTLSILRGFPPRQRDALTRFYVHGHSEQKIGTEMQISTEEFRALKREAKRRFEEARTRPPHGVRRAAGLPPAGRLGLLTSPFHAANNEVLCELDCRSASLAWECPVDRRK